MALNGRNLVDTVTTVIKDENSVLCLVENNLVSLPYSKVMNNSSWRSLSMDDIKEATGLEIPPTSVAKIFKVWMSDQPINCITHCVLFLNLTSEHRKKCRSSTGRFTGKTKWLSENEILKYYREDAICSHVLLEFFPKTLEKAGSLLDLPNTGILYELTDDRITGDNSLNNFETIVDASGLRAIQPMIYREFINNCYPNIMMSPSGFCKIIFEWGIPKDEAIFLFRAADLTNRQFLLFREFLYILSVLEPTTSHGGISGEIRCRYIFRFFDRDQDGEINYAELKTMVIYLRKIKNLAVDQASLQKDLVDYSTSLNIVPSKGINLNEFLKCAGELKIRGLSAVLRLTRSVKSQFTSSRGNSSGNKQNSVEVARIGKVSLNFGKALDFEIAVHSIRIQKSGTMINLEKIWTLNNVASKTTLEQAGITRENRRMSCEIHSEEAFCNELIKYVRYLSLLNKIKSGNRGCKKDQYQWGNVNPTQYAVKLIQVCKLLRDVLKNEQRLLDVKSPLYILGDFHGNFGDLQYFERMFWPLGPGFCPGNLLFLGDYVDRGSFGLEVITYLFCFKLLYPHKIHLLRGNHEIREVQKTFTFFTECNYKFGEKIGFEVWDTINSAFDNLPIAGVVDGKIFCCHGGVPPPWLCPVASAINNIPVPLNEPDSQSSLAWEILWNDPIRFSKIVINTTIYDTRVADSYEYFKENSVKSDKSFNKMTINILRSKQLTPEIDIELKINEGFAFNVKRGTAHVFNSDGLEKFLSTNGFSHVVRAHEMVVSGYNVLLKGKLLTVFSTSKYNNQNNEAACVMVDNGKIRLMRLDTASSF